jgi:hypothetical protein
MKNQTKIKSRMKQSSNKEKEKQAQIQVIKMIESLIKQSSKTNH